MLEPHQTSENKSAGANGEIKLSSFASKKMKKQNAKTEYLTMVNFICFFSITCSMPSF